MNKHFKIQKNIGIAIVIFCAIVAPFDVVNYSVFYGKSIWDGLFNAATLEVLGSGTFFAVISFRDLKFFRLLQALTIFGLSGLMIYTNNPDSFIGYWFLITGTTLLFKYGFLDKLFLWKSLVITTWALVWIWLSANSNQNGNVLKVITYLLFILISLLFLYIIFEDEIRELIKSNTAKDHEIAEKEARIAELEPLSVLGGRVAQVVHSFKNNLSKISTALFLLETGQDPAKAAAKLRTFSQTMLDRIDNVLMISQAGAHQEAELVDLGRLLDGIQFVYLKERIFFENAETVLVAIPNVVVKAVKWDLILLMENLLKNAVEAIAERGIFGKITITLTDKTLTVANNGGAMPLCSACNTDSCLNCTKYGKIGVTTKKGGSGHGLPQVFDTVRDHGWDLKIKVENDVTSFVIRFKKDAVRLPEQV